MTSPLRASAAGAALLLAACNFPAELPACPIAPKETRVNERGDQDEFVSHPNAAAAFSNGRALVAFSAQTVDDAGAVLTSEVRIALVDVATGDRLTLCNTSARDRTLSEPGTFAFGAAVAPVELTVQGSKAVALVAWTEGAALPDSSVRMRFVDGAGCPIALSFHPYAGPAFAVSLAWSQQRRAVLVTQHDMRSVYRSWVDTTGPAETVLLATGQGVLGGFPVNAVAPDGTAVVAWADGSDVRSVLLDGDGNPRPAVAAGGGATPFTVDFPPPPGGAPALYSAAVAVSSARFAVAAEQRTVGRDVASRAMAREYSLDGAPLDPPYLLDASDTGTQGAPAIAYAPGATLVAVWHARSASGSVGRLFGPGGAPRYNSITCDERRFRIGTGAETLLGFPSVVVSGGRVLVFHNAEGASDPRGSATLMWGAQFGELWPGRE